MFAETRSRVHETYCLRRADVALFRGQIKLSDAQWPTADRVEVRFRGSKRDQMSKGAVVLRVWVVRRGAWAMVVAPSIS